MLTSFHAALLLNSHPHWGRVGSSFLIAHDRAPCDLRDYGYQLGMKAQFYRNEVFQIAQLFDGTMDLTRPPARDADQERREGQGSRNGDTMSNTCAPRSDVVIAVRR